MKKVLVYQTKDVPLYGVSINGELPSDTVESFKVNVGEEWLGIVPKTVFIPITYFQEAGVSMHDVTDMDGSFELNQLIYDLMDDYQQLSNPEPFTNIERVDWAYEPIAYDPQLAEAAFVEVQLEVLYKFKAYENYVSMEVNMWDYDDLQEIF